MKNFVLIFLMFLIGSVAAAVSQKSVVCHMKGMNDDISFIIPNKMSDVPKIDFSYPVEVTRFSMRTGNLLLVAMDAEEKERPRIFISAQLNKHAKAYIGQCMTDLGGNQLQLDNGPVSCVLK